MTTKEPLCVTTEIHERMLAQAHSNKSPSQLALISWDFPFDILCDVGLKMATGGNADLTLSVRFASHQLPLYVKQKDTVEYVIKKAAAALKEDREGMELFFKGTKLNEHAKIGVSQAISIRL